VKKRSIGLVTAAILSLGVCISPVVRAFGQPENYSADMVMTGEGRATQAKVFISDKKTRMEMMGNTIITRMDLGVSWVIMASENMYMEQPIDPKMALQTGGDASSEVERISLGADFVNKQPAEKFKVTYSSSRGNEAVYQWMAGGSMIPVKIASIDGSWTVEYRNINTAPQPASLFEVPAGYQKFSMPNMGQMMQTMQSQQND
jgi:hypothetical protein